MTKYSEEKIASFSQKGTRINLLKVIDGEYRVRYQVRLNRKVQKSSVFEYEMRKLFAMLVQNTVLQLKIY